MAYFKLDRFNAWPILIPEATHGNCGMMSGKDKAKLDSITWPGDYDRVRATLVEFVSNGYDVGTTSTTIMDWTSFDSKYERIAFFFVNVGPSVDASFVLDTAEDIGFLDTPYTAITPVGTQSSVVLDNMRTWYRVRASAVSGTTKVNVKVVGA